MSEKKPTIRLIGSNRIVDEISEGIVELHFKEVYQKADRTLRKIIEDNKVHPAEPYLNVLAFLGGKGRGKTSAMRSFLSYLKNTSYKFDWSESEENKRNNIFHVLPLIDAAMLAETEYIVDIILEEMWNEFEEYIKTNKLIHDMKYEQMERDIQQQFIKVHKAYLVLKEREKGDFEPSESGIPVPSVLHELAASLNLQQELQILITDYLDIFEYGKIKENNSYLVIAIDDVDMSGKKAHYILEQIRRFLCIPNVIVLLTADIDRLQSACEWRYKKAYKDALNRRMFISEYLEKVLPYNMRIYLPEIKERHDQIMIETSAKDKLGLSSQDEKGLILEFMAKKCGIYFDPKRRKRHFLQNQSLRSMVNYFEQIVRMQGDYLSWLKIDLKERLVERIPDKAQKDFMCQLLSSDYEDINSYLITYFGEELDEEFPNILGTNVQERNLGQVLYACVMFENKDIRNVDFVNAVIMLYSIILRQLDESDMEDTKQKIMGESLWGSQEYGLINSIGKDSVFCLSFNNTNGSLELNITPLSESELVKRNKTKLFNDIIKDNRDDIIAWICSLLFFTMDSNDVKKSKFKVEAKKNKPLNEEISKKAEDSNTNNSLDAEKNIEKIVLTPLMPARKSYLTNAFVVKENIIEQISNILDAALSALMEWIDIQTKNSPKFQDKEKIITKTKQKILDEVSVFGKNIDGKFKGQDEKTNIGNEKKISHYEEISVEILYSLGKKLSELPSKFQDEDRVGFQQLVSVYEMIIGDLREREENFSDLSRLRKNFEQSLPAQILLNPDILSSGVRAKFEIKLDILLMDYTGGTVVVKK